jgi:hypothetical protein
MYKYTAATGINDYQLKGAKQEEIAKYLTTKNKYHCIDRI